MPDGLLVAKRDGNFNAYDKNDLWSFNVGLSSETPYADSDFSYDMDPDIFTFSFNGYTGSFIINNNGLPEMINENGCKINIDSLSIQSYSTSSIPVSSIIKIVTPDGYKYRFGGDLSCLQWFIPSNPAYCKIVPRHIISWFLESIEAPNKRKVTFFYTNTLQKAKYNYLISSCYFQNTQAIFPSGLPNYSYGIRNKNYLMEDQVYTPLIDKISIDDTEIIFSKGMTEDGFYTISDLSDRSSYLKSITHKYNGELFKKDSFSYKKNNNYLFLSSIKVGDALYSFKYNEAINLPDPLTLSVDHWGYWNGGYVKTISDDDISDYCSNLHNDRKTNPLYCDVALLDTVVYPTSGFSIIAYECNRYRNYFERDTNSIKYDMITVDSIVFCGGARVKTIYDYKDGSIEPQKRSYSYKESFNGMESGVTGLIPKYTSKEDIFYTYYSYPVTYGVYTTMTDASAISLGSNNMLSKYHISYPYVIEQFDDDSYISYHYSSLIDVPICGDINIQVFDNYASNLNSYQIAERYNFYEYNDLSSFRGLLLYKKNHSSQGVVFRNEVYTYNISSSKSKYNISLRSTPRGRVAYKIYLNPCLLVKKNTTMDGVEKTKLYSYNSRCILREELVINSDSTYESIFYKYPFDYNLDDLDSESLIQYYIDYADCLLFGSTDNYLVAIKRMEFKNMISNPIEIVRTKTKNGNKWTQYGILNNFIIDDYLPLKKNTFRFETDTDTISPFSDKYYTDLTEELVYKKYNSYGYPVYVESKDSMKVCFLWSYSGQKIVAKIENTTYSAVETTIGSTVINSLASSIIPSSSGLSAVNALRTSLTNALVTTYTYKPLVGMTSMTDPRGLTTTYEYDNLNRLKCIKDHDGNIVQQYDYHYAE